MKLFAASPCTVSTFYKTQIHKLDMSIPAVKNVTSSETEKRNKSKNG